MMRSLGRLRFIAPNFIWCYLGLGIILFRLLVVLYSVLQLVMVEVLLVLGTSTSPTIKLHFILLRKDKSVLIFII